MSEATLNGEAPAVVRPAGASPIPHIFHFLWLDGTPPQEFSEYLVGWGDAHPKWHIYFWERRDLVHMQNQDLIDRASEIAPDSEDQFVSDVARLEIVKHFGGVYVDFDFECLKPIEELVAPNDPLPSRLRDPLRFFAAWEEQDKWVNNAIFGAEAEHPFLQMCIDRMPGHIEQLKGPGIRANVLSGPQFLTRMYLNWVGGELTIFPQEAFYPYSWNELHRKGEKFPNAYAVHHWNNQRKKKG